MPAPALLPLLTRNALATDKKLYDVWAQEQLDKKLYDAVWKRGDAKEIDELVGQNANVDWMHPECARSCVRLPPPALLPLLTRRALATDQGQLNKKLFEAAKKGDAKETDALVG